MENKTPPLELAIVLPVYNVIEHLPSMIDALYESTEFPFKLIIIDGFSDDGTYEYIKNLKDEWGNVRNIELYQLPKKGIVNAINFGIKKAGKLDVYLTQPDVIHVKLYKRDWLQLINMLSKNDGIGLISGEGGYGVSGPDCIDGFKWFGTWNTYIPRKVIDIVGLYDEDFLGMDDIDYSYRVNLAGFKNVIVKNYWVDHHQLTDRRPGHNSDNLKEMGKLFRKKWKLGEYKDE